MKCKLAISAQYVGGKVSHYRGTGFSYTNASWRYFYPRCSKILQSLGICNSKAGAWVPATTVCSQKLF